MKLGVMAGSGEADYHGMGGGGWTGGKTGVYGWVGVAV